MNKEGSLYGEGPAASPRRLFMTEVDVAAILAAKDGDGPPGFLAFRGDTDFCTAMRGSGDTSWRRPRTLPLLSKVALVMCALWRGSSVTCGLNLLIGDDGALSFDRGPNRDIYFAIKILSLQKIMQYLVVDRK